MKSNATTLFLGLCLALLAVAASPAYARSTTGFSAFKVESPLVMPNGLSPYTCLTEDNGAVINNCPYAISLEFGMESDTAGTKTIGVQNYWAGSDAQETFACDTYAYTGSEAFSSEGTPTINFSEPKQNLTSNLVATAGESIQLICWNVPPGGGVANINWTK